MLSRAFKWVTNWLMGASRTRNLRPLKTQFADLTVADAMTLDPVTVSPEMNLSHVINRVILSRQFSFLPVVEDGVLLGKIDRNVLSGIDRENWKSTKVGDIFVQLDQDQTLIPDTNLSAVLKMIARTDQRKFLVSQNRHLLGVITLADIVQYLEPDPRPGDNVVPP